MEGPRIEGVVVHWLDYRTIPATLFSFGGCFLDVTTCGEGSTTACGQLGELTAIGGGLVVSFLRIFDAATPHS